jgi:hypothetical protein
MKEALKTLVHGQVTVTDRSTGEVLMEKANAIHPANMAIAIARGLSNTAHYQIFKLKLGNQGTYIDSSQQIVFRPPNTTGTTADLYNPTYVEVVDDSDSGVGVGNSVTFTNIPGSTSTRVIVTMVVSANEAVNRQTDGSDSDTADGGGLDGIGVGGAIPSEGQYFFDELGLFTEGSGTPDLLNESDELMLSHLIFSPIEHTGNRELVVIYTLTVTVS